MVKQKTGWEGFDFSQFKYARIGREDFVLERMFRTKMEARKYADRLRKKKGGGRVRVLKRSKGWGVYSG